MSTGKALKRDAIYLIQKVITPFPHSISHGVTSLPRASVLKGTSLQPVYAFFDLIAFSFSSTQALFQHLKGSTLLPILSTSSELLPVRLLCCHVMLR